MFDPPQHEIRQPLQALALPHGPIRRTGHARILLRRRKRLAEIHPHDAVFGKRLVRDAELLDGPIEEPPPLVVVPQDVAVLVGRPDEHPAAVDTGDRVQRRILADAELVVQRRPDRLVEPLKQLRIVHPPLDHRRQAAEFAAKLGLQIGPGVQPFQDLQPRRVILRVAGIADQLLDARFRIRDAARKAGQKREEGQSEPHELGKQGRRAHGRLLQPGEPEADSLGGEDLLVQSSRSQNSSPAWRAGRGSRRAVGVSPSVHCLGDHFSNRLLLNANSSRMSGMWTTGGLTPGRSPRQSGVVYVQHRNVDNRRAYASRSPLGMQQRGSLSVTGGRWLGLDEHDLRARNPALSQVHPEPAVAVLLVDAGRRSLAELLQVVLRPGLAQVRGNR